MSGKSAPSPLSRLLRQADPLAEDPGPSPGQTAELRRAVLARAREESPRLWPQHSPALSVAAVLTLALGAAWWSATTDRSTPAPPPRSEATVSLQTPSAKIESAATVNALENRKIQFETPGGTLVVWVLNPNFPS